MKSSIIICSILITTVQFSHQDQLGAKLTKDYFATHEESKKACLAEVIVDKTIEYSYEVNGEVINDENLGCFMKCLVLKENMMNEAGDLSIENIRKVFNLPDNLPLDGLEKQCSQYDKINLCIGVMQFVNCGVDYLKSILPK